MKVSIDWLKQYYDAGLAADEMSKILTNTGLEIGGVEAYESIPGGLEGLVIGEIIAVEKHPNADRLNLTKVNVGTEVLDIVCGAPNVAEGQKVVVATVGTLLHPIEGEPFKIKKGKIRGEVSNGMICAEDEIGLGEGHDGIMVLDKGAEVGGNAGEYFNIANDKVLEIDLTPNRSDAFSHIGVARDLRAYQAVHDENNMAELKWPDVSEFKADNNDLAIEVIVKDTSACPRYSGLTVSNVKVGPSPQWMQDRLKAIGLKPINNIVDITNYIQQELGQPLHAFDASKIEGNQVIVKQLPNKTKFTTLDEEERELSEKDLMICNAKEGMCIAGVFGGLESGVSEGTTSIFLESAYFSPVGIRKTARRHGLSTDASFRYERGTDPEITVYALKRAAMLVKELAGGEISSEITDIYPLPIDRVQVDLTYDRCDKLIGVAIDRKTIKTILQSLDFVVLNEGPSGLKLEVPLYRTDVRREVDVIEEILRIYGYDQVDMPESLRSAIHFSGDVQQDAIQQQIANMLSSSGFAEIMTNSLTKSKYNESSASTSVEILNPLSSELGVMRQDLLRGALEVLVYNQNRKAGLQNCYEFGKIYFKDQDKYIEKRRLSLLVSEINKTERWEGSKGELSFYQLKKQVELVLRRLGILDQLVLETVEGDDFFQYAAVYRSGEKELVRFGELKQNLLQEFDLSTSIFHAIFDWDLALKRAGKQQIAFHPIPKFPEVRRDLALLLDDKVQFSAIEKVAVNTDRQLLKSVDLFDVYKGKGLDEGKKSYAVSFYFGSEEKTLKDQQVDKSIKKIYDRLTQELGAVLRQGEI